jgi:hypothetical protein
MPPALHLGAVRSWPECLLELRGWPVYHLNALGDSAAQAIVAGEPLVADFERVLGPDHPDTLTSRNNLATAYRAAGRAGLKLCVMPRHAEHGVLMNR